jgi:hypothetical protein
MRSFLLLAITLWLVGCDREATSDPPPVESGGGTAYPAKVTALLKLIEQLEPGTNEHDWIERVDRTIDLPNEDVILEGGGGLGESWLTIGIGAGDEWALSIESCQKDHEIWEAMVVRTSVSKWLANEPCEVEAIYPHYYKGRLVGSEDEKLQLKSKKGSDGAAEVRQR